MFPKNAGMLLLLTLLVPLGPVRVADRPGPPARSEGAPATAARLIGPGAPAPPGSAGARRVRLRARLPEREDDTSPPGRGAAAVAPPPVPRGPCRGSPYAPELSAEPRIYTFCTLLC